MSKKVVLVITDGIGYSNKTQSNAFYHAKKPTYDQLFRKTPHSLIETSGISVGLPDGQMGNSEVGHMSIGSGRVLYQDLVKISLAIENKSIEKNEVFQTLLDASERLHIIGLMSDGGVHSHLAHFMALADIAAKRGKRVFLHLIADGRDVSPSSANKYIQIVKKHLNENVSIASLSGRFYTMDRDNRWDRVEKSFNAIVNAEPQTSQNAGAYIEASYEKEIYDEFLEPTAFSSYDGMQEGDSVVTINFRSDRMREMVSALGAKDFVGFSKKELNINLATITEYDKSFSYPVMFTKETPKNTLSEVISNAGLRQLHTAETEKYAHVTFFFNGGVDEPYANETRVLIPSPNVKTYDMQPQMSVEDVSNAVLDAMDEEYDFIVVNFANGDMVGHTGVFEAAKKAVSAVDAQLGKIKKKSQAKEYSLVITSDHGNCEEMRDDEGNILTNHTVGKVWCFVEAKGVKKVKEGALNNIAPTVLKLLGLEIPSEMDDALI